MNGLIGAVVAPSTPLLLPGTGGAAGTRVVDDVLERALSEIRAVQALSPTRWVVVGTVPAGTGSSGVGATAADQVADVVGAVAPWPGRGPAGPQQCALGVTIGRHLLSSAGVDSTPELVTVPIGLSPADSREFGRTVSADGAAVLIIGDGCARRTRQSPGDFDDRAEGFDDAIERALAVGDVDGLAELDPDLAEQLMCGGRAPLQVLAGAFGAARRRPVVSTAGVLAVDPLGVRYWVTSWT